jgi:hypothetical protein
MSSQIPPEKSVQLHDVGCERDRAGNRSLQMDQYWMLILLYMLQSGCHVAAWSSAGQRAEESPKKTRVSASLAGIIVRVRRRL